MWFALRSWKDIVLNWKLGVQPEKCNIVQFVYYQIENWSMVLEKVRIRLQTDGYGNLWKLLEMLLIGCFGEALDGICLFKSFRDFLGGGRAEHLQEYVEGGDHMNLS